MRSPQSTAIDNARAALIIGLIAYHAARVFDPYVFYVKGEQFDALGPLILFGAVWGMPVFFLAAGFALWHSFSARGTGSFIRERGKRLLVPLTVGLVTIVPLQLYVARRASGEQVTYLDSLRDFLSVHFTPQLPVPLEGAWFDYSHLWFLAYLLAFSLFLLPAVIWARRLPESTRLSSRHAKALWIVALAAAAALEARYGMEGTGAWDRWSYLVFMAMGILLAWQPSFGEILAKRRHLLAGGAFLSLVALVLAVVLRNYSIPALTSGTDLEPTLWRAGKGISGVLFLMAIVGSLACWRPATEAAPERRSALVVFRDYLKPISLPLYLLHQTVIVVLAYFIVQWPIPAIAQFLAIVLLTLSFSISTIELGRRTRFGSLLLGMKYKPRARQPRPARRTPEQDHEPVPTPAPALVSSP